MKTLKTRIFHLYQIGFAEAGLQIGQSAFLWKLFANPRLLYGVESWPVSPLRARKNWKVLNFKVRAESLGKKYHRTTVNEALRGDLEWLSVKSQVALAKLKYYGHLCRLPQERLLDFGDLDQPNYCVIKISGITVALGFDLIRV